LHITCETEILPTLSHKAELEGNKFWLRTAWRNFDLYRWNSTMVPQRLIPTMRNSS